MTQTNITGGTKSTTPVTLKQSTDDSLTIDSTSSLIVAVKSTPAVLLDLTAAPASAGIVINNAGTLQSGTGLTGAGDRTIDTGSGAAVSGSKVSITNSGTIQNLGNTSGNDDGIRINTDLPAGTFLLYNYVGTNAGSGVISTSGNVNDSVALRLGKVYTAKTITINNGIDAKGNITTGAVISTADADAIRPGGVNAGGTTVTGSGSNQTAAGFGSSTINNYGTISASYQTGSQTAYLTKDNGIDIGAGQAATVNNYGTIVGDESGLGADNSAGTTLFAPTYYVTNYAGATITGNNGPAIAIGNNTSATASSTTSTITNYGTIAGKATGVGRTKTNGVAPTVSAANGTGIYSFYAVTIVNGSTTNSTATISGSGTVGTTAPQGGATYYAINASSGSITNYGTISETTATNAGAAIFISGSIASTVTNYGTITGAGTAAITMGSGNDTINLYTGGTINGTIDGGAGSDTLNLYAGSSTTTGTLTGVVNTEILAVNSGSWTIADAETYGSGATIASGANLTIGPNGSTNATIVDNGTLTYVETGTFTKSQPISGTGKVVQAGTGTLILQNSGNSYSGGTNLNSGTLDVTAAGAAGTGAITFGSGAQTLDIEQAALNSDGSFTNTLAGVDSSDTIDLRGVGTETATSFNSSTNKLTVTGGSEAVTLQLDTAGAPPSGYAYGVSSDGNGGTLVALDQIATVQSLTTSPSSGYVMAGQTVTITITLSKAVTINGTAPVLNLQGGGTATYTSGSGSTKLIFTDTVAQGQDASGIVVTSVTNASSAQDTYDVPVDFSGAVNQPATGPVIDTTPPTVAITSMGGLTNQATQTISGTVDTADNGTTVTVYETYNGTTNKLGTAPVSNGSWQTTINLSTGNGAHTIYATDTDAAGNTGTSASVSYDLETTAPPVMITSPGGLTNQPMQTLTGSVDVSADPEAKGTTVTVTDTGTGKTLGTGTVDNNGNFSVNVTLSGDGSHTLQAGDTDQAGNSGFASVTYTLDTTPPAAPTAKLANDTGVSSTDNITSDPTITYSASANGDTLLYKVDNGSYSTNAPTFATDGSADGQHTVYVEEEDPAGNISAASSLTFTLDTTPPTTAPSLALTNDTGASSTDNYTSDPTISYMAGTNGDTLLYKVGNGAYSANAPSFTADGTYTVSVEDEDTAGNIGPSSSLTFTLDTTPPGAPSVSLTHDTGSSNSDNVTSDPTISYKTASAGDTLLYKVGSGAYSSTAPTFSTDGTYTVSAEEVDKAGNIGPATSLTFTLDTTPPDIDFTSMGGSVNQSTQIVNGMVGVEDAGTTVSIFEDGGTNAVATAVVNSSGYFSASINLGANGTHTLTASDTDVAGNTGTTDQSLTYNVDTTQPTFTPGNLVISISGDGDGSGSYSDNQATPLVLQQITTDGTYVSQIVLPQATTTVNGVTESVISAEYGSSSEGSLQLSADGHSLVIAGYGVNAQTYNAGGAAVYGNAALAQSTSIQGGQYTAVPRVIADINANGTIDTSTSLYNVYNGNNPRSVATIDGSSFYISGQGMKGDTTQGVFLVQDGASTVTKIDQSTDTRTAVIYNGQLYVSRDSKQGSGGTSNIAVYGPNLPTAATKPTILEAIDKSVVITAATGNTVNGSASGSSVNLDPENFFFANANTLYVADGGVPKQGGVGDGGLQKWTYNGSQWTLQYTLSQGLGIVQPGADEGTTGLIGLTGRVDADGTVELYATNETVGDTDQKYVFGITDQLGATTNAGQSFTTLVTAAPDTNIRGIAFAPTPITPTIALKSDTGISGTDDITSNPTLVVTPAVKGDTLLYSVDGSAYTTTAPTFATDGSQDGTHTVSVEEQDKGGAIGPAASLTFTLDTQAPNAPPAPTLTQASDTGSSSSDGITDDATPTVTGSAEAGSTVTLYNGSTVLGSAQASSMGIYSITTPTLADGTYALTVNATDAAGNVSTASAALNITMDTIAPGQPTAPMLTAASDTGSSSSDGITNDTTPTFTGTAEAGSTVTLYDGTKQVGTATVGSTGTYTVTSSALGYGTHSLTVTATDTAGNVSAASAATSVMIDTRPPNQPSVPTLTAASDSGSSSTDNITNDATPSFTGLAEAGSIITLYSDGTKVGTATTTSSGAYAVTASTLKDGSHSMTVTATDVAGNVSKTSTARTVTIDTTAPGQPTAPTLTAASDTGSSSTDGITNDATPTFTGTAEAGATVTLYDGTKQVGSATAGSSGTYNVTASTLGYGTHSLTVTATDKGGNVSAASAATSVTIDTRPPNQPSVPTLTAASDSGASSTDNVTNDATPTFTGTAEATSIITLYDGGTKVGTATTTSSGTYTVTASTLTDGSHAMTVTATDVAGNVSKTSTARTITIDTAAPGQPTAPTLTAASDMGSSSTDGITNDATPTFTGTAEAGATVTLYDGTKQVGSTTAGSSGTYNVTASTLGYGTHSLTVTATDKAGNVSASSAATSVMIDTRPPNQPSVPTLTAASDSGASSTDNVTNDATPTFTGTAEAGSIVTLYDGSTKVGTATTTSSGTYTVTASTLKDGSHAMSVTATDLAGNVSKTSTARTIIIDTTAPGQPTAPTLTAASDTGSSSSDGITNDTTPTVTGTAEAGSTVTLYDGTKQIGSATAGSGGVYTIASSTLASGTHSLTVTATDKAGNVSAASATTSVTIDTRPPNQPSAPILTAASDSGSSSSDGVTNDTTPTFTGTAEAGSTVTLYDGSTKVGTATTTSSGAYTVTASALKDGSHAMSVTATDLAGNVSKTSTARTITIDTAAPIVAITSSGGTVTTPNQTISGTGEAGTSVSLTDNGKAIGGTLTVGSNGTWSGRIALSSGSNKIVATDTDKAGNVGTSSAVTYNYGTSAAQASSLHSLVQAMAVMTPSSSASMSPTAAATPQQAHPLAAAHA